MNKPIYIGNNALNLNDHGLYSIINNNYNAFMNERDSVRMEALSSFANIKLVQKLFLDLTSAHNIFIAGVSINFEDDYWDFSAKQLDGKPYTLYRFNFNCDIELTPYHKNLLKIYVIFLINEKGLHCGSNQSTYCEIRKFFSYISSLGITFIDNVTLDDYKDFYANRNLKYNTMIQYRRHIYEFIKFYSLLTTNILSPELDSWFSEIDQDIINANQLVSKVPLLPTDFYSKYRDLLYTSCLDITADKYYRARCGLLYIGTQVGLRAAELTILRVSDLEVYRHGDKIVGVLHYRSTKRGNGKSNVYIDAETVANYKVIEIFTLLQDIMEPEREMYKSDLLVPFQAEGKYLRKNSLTLAASNIQNFNITFCLKYYNELNLLNRFDQENFAGNHRITMKCTKYPWRKLKTMNVKVGDVMSYPTTRQYRVYVATELRERGISDRITARLLNHGSVEMYGYYVRPTHEVQEDIDFAREIITNVVKDQTKILGPKGEAFENKIDKIITDNNFQVEKDLDAIIEAVCSEMPIRAKLGGFCVKSNPRRECRHDADTDEFYCAYGCCPNHCYTYYMLPITYKKVCELKKLYDYNIINGYVNAAGKEGYKLAYIIKNELKPQINDTKIELQRKSVKEILSKHKDMQEVIYKLDEIEEEVNKWMILINQ